MSFLVSLFVIVFALVSIALPIYALNQAYLLMAARRYKTGRKEELTEYPLVTIQLSIYNELYVVERLLSAVTSLDYPRERLQIVIVDDSTDETSSVLQRLVERYARDGFDIQYIRRENREWFKAGALRDALKVSKGEFIAIFDADFIPSRDFLKRILPFFNSRDTGMVQARWGHVNRSYSGLTAAQGLSLDLHFRVEQAGKNQQGAFINFNGSAGVWRRSCIVDAGGWLPSLAEDLDLSYRAQLKGWRFMYVDDIVAPAELPVQINAARKQQYRWAFGTVRAAVKYLPGILLSGLSPVVKTQALLHLTRHFSQFFFVMQALMIPLIIKLGLASSLAAMMGWLLLYPALVIISGLLLRPRDGSGGGLDGLRGRDALHLLLFGTGMSINNTIAIIHALIVSDIHSERTPKLGISSVEQDWWQRPKYILSFMKNAALDIAFGLFPGYVALLSFYAGPNTYAFIPVALLISVSCMYAGLLTIAHSIPTARIPRRLLHLQRHRLRVVASVTGFMVVWAVVSYGANAYQLALAHGELVRATATSDAAEMIERVENALRLLPAGGNPVWILPTPATDLAMIREDLSKLIQVMVKTSETRGDYELLHATSENVRMSLETVQHEISSVLPFAWIGLAGLALTALLLTFTSLALIVSWRR